MNSYNSIKKSKEFSSDKTLENTGFTTAKSYYTNTLKLQKEIIRKDILNAMQKGDARIIFSVQPYDSIQDELIELGWTVDSFEKNDADVYYITCNFKDLLDSKDEKDPESSKESTFITPEKYFEAIIQKQREIIEKDIAKAKGKGEGNVDISVVPCDIIENELSEAGWYIGTYYPEEVEVFYLWFEESDVDESEEISDGEKSIINGGEQFE